MISISLGPTKAHVSRAYVMIERILKVEEGPNKHCSHIRYVPEEGKCTYLVKLRNHPN